MKTWSLVLNKFTEIYHPTNLSYPLYFLSFFKSFTLSQSF